MDPYASTYHLSRSVAKPHRVCCILGNGGAPRSAQRSSRCNKMCWGFPHRFARHPDRVTFCATGSHTDTADRTIQAASVQAATRPWWACRQGVSSTTRQLVSPNGCHPSVFGSRVAIARAPQPKSRIPGPCLAGRALGGGGLGSAAVTETAGGGFCGSHLCPSAPRAHALAAAGW